MVGDPALLLWGCTICTQNLYNFFSRKYRRYNYLNNYSLLEKPFKELQWFLVYQFISILDCVIRDLGFYYCSHTLFTSGSCFDGGCAFRATDLRIPESFFSILSKCGHGALSSRRGGYELSVAAAYCFATSYDAEIAWVWLNKNLPALCLKTGVIGYVMPRALGYV